MAKKKKKLKKKLSKKPSTSSKKPTPKKGVVKRGGSKKKVGKSLLKKKKKTASSDPTPDGPVTISDINAPEQLELEDLHEEFDDLQGNDEEEFDTEDGDEGYF